MILISQDGHKIQNENELFNVKYMFGYKGLSKKKAAF